MLRPRAAAVTLALCACLVALPAALAGAAKPKRGYFIDAKLQVYAQVGASRTSITSFQAPCLMQTPSTHALVSTGSFTIPKAKHPKINGAGSFSYTGNVTLVTSSKAVVKVQVKGKFAGGKLKGTVKFLGQVGCEDYAYTGKYYGVNPQG